MTIIEHTVKKTQGKDPVNSNDVVIHQFRITGLTDNLSSEFMDELQSITQKEWGRQIFPFKVIEDFDDNEYISGSDPIPEKGGSCVTKKELIEKMDNTDIIPWWVRMTEKAIEAAKQVINKK